MIKIEHEENLGFDKTLLHTMHTAIGIGVDRGHYYVFPLVSLGVPIQGFTKWNSLVMLSLQQGITNLMIIKCQNQKEQQVVKND